MAKRICSSLAILGLLSARAVFVILDSKSYIAAHAVVPSCCILGLRHDRRRITSCRRASRGPHASS
jgi:hypothetical protein